MEGTKVKLILVLFIIYLILLMWLFDFLRYHQNIDNQKNPVPPITVIINNINNINILYSTLDRIKTDHSFDQIDLILFDNTNNDLESIINPYSQSFRKINIYKMNQCDYDDIDINSINTEYILIINSGMIIAKKFIEKSFQYINKFNISIMFAPIYKLSNNNKNLFSQLFGSFKQAIKCSLINKNLYAIKKYDNNGFIIKKDSFNKLLHGKKKYYDHQKYIVDTDLCINDINLNSKNNLNYFYKIYIGINLLYFFVITLFLSTPNYYYLAIIIIKVIPELYYIYSYHNKLKIKFPKIEFIIYSIFLPIYMIIELFSKRILNINSK